MFDAELGRVYALALVAIARADGEIGPDEGHRLDERIRSRTHLEVPLDELLLAEPIQPVHLAEAIEQSPFRGSGLRPLQLAEMLITDGLAVILAKGHATNAETRAILAFVRALGCTNEDTRRLSGALARWLPDDHT